MIEALAWTGFVLLVLGNVYSILANTVSTSKESGLLGLFFYVVITTWLTWSCFHLLRFA
jgi:hypothetical protein